MTVFYIVMVCHATLPDERFITPRYNLQPVKLDRMPVEIVTRLLHLTCTSFKSRQNSESAQSRNAAHAHHPPHTKSTSRRPQLNKYGPEVRF